MPGQAANWPTGRFKASKKASSDVPCGSGQQNQRSVGGGRRGFHQRAPRSFEGAPHRPGQFTVMKPSPSDRRVGDPNLPPSDFRIVHLWRDAYFRQKQVNLWAGRSPLIKSMRSATWFSDGFIARVGYCDVFVFACILLRVIECRENYLSY